MAYFGGHFLLTFDIKLPKQGAKPKAVKVNQIVRREKAGAILLFINGQ